MFQNQSLMRQIEGMLMELGMSPALKGFHYLAQCVYLCVEDIGRVHSMIAKVYGPVGAATGGDYQQVERSIRHLVKSFVDRNRIQELNRMLHARLYTAGDYPCNSELIACLAEHIRLHQDGDPRAI